MSTQQAPTSPHSDTLLKLRAGSDNATTSTERADAVCLTGRHFPQGLPPSSRPGAGVHSVMITTSVETPVVYEDLSGDLPVFDGFRYQASTVAAVDHLSGRPFSPLVNLHRRRIYASSPNDSGSDNEKDGWSVSDEIFGEVGNGLPGQSEHGPNLASLVTPGL